MRIHHCDRRRLAQRVEPAPAQPGGLDGQARRWRPACHRWASTTHLLPVLPPLLPSRPAKLWAACLYSVLAQTLCLPALTPALGALCAQVAVERYIFFPSSRASLGLKGPSLMDTGRWAPRPLLAHPPARPPCRPAIQDPWLPCTRAFGWSATCPVGQPRPQRPQVTPCTGSASAWPDLPRCAHVSRAVCRDEDAERGMLMVALDVLTRVHAAVLRALRSPPMPLPTGELVYQNWDVRHALGTERQQVGMQGVGKCLWEGPARCACVWGRSCGLHRACYAARRA